MGTCKECGAQLVRKGPGPRPTYCSATCRAKRSYRKAREDGRYAEQLAKQSERLRAERVANARPCPYCGDPMTHPRRVQCGKAECKRLWTNERNRAWQRKYKAETGRSYARTFAYECVCETCGRSWKASQAQARFCSIACSNHARSFPVACEQCGRSWTSKTSKVRWCSQECEHASHFSTELLPWRPEPWWARRAPVPVRRPRRWYAGRCRRCCTWFVSEQPANSYCSRRCGNADGKDRRRARKKNAFVEPVYRQKVFERDRWVCQLCRRRVNRNATAPHPRAPVIDHVIPLNKGGTHEPANVQCAHFICNSIKSDRGGGEQLALIG